MNFRELFLKIVDNFPDNVFLTKDISDIAGITLQEAQSCLHYLRRIGIINNRKDPSSTHGKRFLWYITSWGWSYLNHLEGNESLPDSSEEEIKEEEKPDMDDEWRREEENLIGDLEMGDEKDRKIAEKLKLLRTIEEEI